MKQKAIERGWHRYRPRETRRDTDLRYLALTALPTAALWIPYNFAQVLNGPLSPANNVDPTPRPLPLWGADRTYLNAVERFAPLAALVVVAHVSGKPNAMTAFWSTCLFWRRLAHALVFLLGILYVRTIIFTLGFVAVVGLFRKVIS
jgi:uncharacterized MAPEG superfamily protein